MPCICRVNAVYVPCMCTTCVCKLHVYVHVHLCVHVCNRVSLCAHAACMCRSVHVLVLATQLLQDEIKGKVQEDEFNKTVSLIRQSKTRTADANNCNFCRLLESRWRSRESDLLKENSQLQDKARNLSLELSSNRSLWRLIQAQ